MLIGCIELLVCACELVTVVPTSEAFNRVLACMVAGVDVFLAYKFLRDSEMVAFRSDRISLEPFSCEQLGT